MPTRYFLIPVVVLFNLTGHAEAQPRTVRPEVSASAAWGHLFRAEDRTFGDELNVGAAIGARAARVAVEFELNRMFGLAPEAAPCGLPLCVGSARSGVTSALVASGNVRYHFGNSRHQPYITGGAGAMRTHSIASILYSRNGVGTFEEREENDTGFAFNVGGGVHMPLTDSFSLRPEIRIYDSSVMSRQNLALIRTSIGAAYSW